MEKSIIREILREEVKPAMGCTEPVAVALAAAHAVKLVSGEIEELKITVSSNIYKNAKAVGIPGIDYTGVEIAALLGISIMRPELDLTIFSELQPEEIQRALELKESINLELEIAYESPSVYVEIDLTTKKENVRVIIAERHTRVVFISKNGKVIFDKRDLASAESTQENNNEKGMFLNYSLEEIINECYSLEIRDFRFLLEGVAMNLSIARQGMEIEKGLRLGRTWETLNSKGYLNNDLTAKIAKYTGAASDARMSGVKMPVMSSAGSGNHGLVAIIPITLVAEEYNSSEEDLILALIISHLVTLYIKEYIGRLSPVCGCAVAAGAGAGAGITYLLGGNKEQIAGSIKNTIATLSGMLCDGGKVGCALKLCMSAINAWWNALFALENVLVPADNGILANNLQQTIINLQKLNKEGMKDTDRVIVSILRDSK